ncbi:multi-sensor signal transduction histidine kinase [Trichormus variabilis ATCC 29413]|uniref:histidine kinase n=2 Tax=Anabaena variabilis TaxID=264691 RepID=Q3MDV2_TRIV2|nr:MULTISPECIES: GAF domain-containing protein [Nostocaceae]ABA20834.1 multi-sensor signal transduction histidine kinase [Trichormus variabilis ATCC 29413]MBC1217182.1 GAF domain-containing protein [Trichormus variabilis ARAD]MBC1256909.1 GAF domain-containing protein [Trichormus variabilis V5]MBC1266565.1 GAF domain-containing protein [Trichormus variabilis FSR]MBC1303011.1 GAF domain-containing protein [Trichormus variabilis N2B]
MENSSTVKPIQTNSGPESQPDMKTALSGVISRIRQSLDIETIFQITVTEVRQLLNADRVGVFRFYPELRWEGKFIYEDVGSEWISVLTSEFSDGLPPTLSYHCFAEEFAQPYQQGTIKVIDNIYQAGISDYHIQRLEKLQVRAKVAAPLIKGKELWGLLCVHQCSTPRQWEASEIEFVQLIAEHLGVALQQADYLEQVKAQSAQLAQAKARETAAEWQRCMAIAIEKIRQSLDLESIFRTSTIEIRKLVNADRVAIYRFNPDWSGEFVFESFADGWISLIDEQEKKPELRKNVSECSAKDLASTPTVDTYLQETRGGSFTKCEIYRVCNDIYNAGFSDCYIKILETYQARAYVIIAIYHGQKLWGLLAIYQNAGVRDWQDDEVYLLTQISTQLGVALQQAEYLQQMQTQASEIAKAAERQRALANTVEKIRRSLDLDTIFKTTTQEVLSLLGVERVAIYRFYPDWSGEFVADSIVDGWTPIVKPQPVTERLLLQEIQAGKYARNEVFVPISQGDKLWGLLVAYQNSQPRYWQDEEINLLAQVGVQLGVALQQAETLQQLKVQAVQLAQAAARERKAAEREKALAATVEKIRRSLDLDTIFATSTEEVRRLLEVDRVIIYRFQPDWSGEFVAESLGNGWTPVNKLLTVITDDCLQKSQGEYFVNGKILVVKDIYSQDYSRYHLALIEAMEARAYIVVPIFQGEKLWGLLAAYQNTQPRDWQEEEVDLLVQIANQLGVGLQQAELLEQTHRQKEEITQTLKELQATQSQLIQSEKMAGLGQLVAGIAHEINNPISFIYGNITYVTEHIENVFQLLHLYQKNYPKPKAEIQENITALDLDFITDDVPKILSSIKFGAERISQLVLSLRIFARLNEAEMKMVNLHEGIDSTLLILQHRLQANTNILEIEVIKEYGDLPEIFCYAAQMNQVFMNIINNAIDALEKSILIGGIVDKPQIKISTKFIKNNAVVICIADNGCGIPEAMRSRIFEPFFTTKEPGQGTGLGLSISYQIVVEKHGGQIKCISELGKGSEFSIEIPIK